ncbi:hypothetical protein [Leptolyngbya sp. NIES-2104]|uniref:hypothetical protein n=1 Tax=Leptolyngbya sp. NIES-2104 TaxID=1552121 RepID=UPI0006EC8EA7|nr:hypothetical protein [Leptolyngbya sp. NIES-2104]GAP97689.1 hypothetical protein NIES2104_42360 [Leptolyngbya sp. NIES-2104]
MAGSRNEAKRNLLNALKSLALEGNFQDWIIVLLVLTVPLVAAFSIANLISSVIANFVAPVIFTPILRSIGIDSMQSLVIGGLRIGAFVYDLVDFIFVVLILFVMTRFLRRMI